MNTKRRTKTDTPTQLTAEEHEALVRVHHATAGEDRWKCGLEYICNRLDDAREYAENAAARILPNVADVKLNPAPTLASLCVTPPGWQPAVKLSELCELIFAQLQKEIALKPDVELLYHGNKRLETFASDWFVFLFGWNNCSGCFALMQKKIALARALGKHGAADKLDEAFRQIMPAFALTDCGDKDAERFAAEITPDNFHAAFRNALKLDAEATDEINGTESQKPVNAVIVGEQAEQLAAAADNSQAAVDEMGEWRGFIKQLIAGYDGDGISPSPLTANKQQAIHERWNEYTTDCKRKRTRPTYAGCLDEHGRDNIYKGHTLLELVQTAQGLERVVHNVKEQARRK